jgi:signal transduction histidine kinase
MCYRLRVNDEAAVAHPGDLRALSERIEQMREEERTRIARELHDELGQLLTGIKLDFSVAVRRVRDLKVPGDVVDRLQSAMGQIDIGISMVRRIATDLRPAQLDHHDLAGAIEYEARQVSARAGLRIRVTTHVNENVAPERATATFRIFQEALTNAVRHAQPTAIAARVSTWRSRLLLCVRDNGVGLAEQAIESPCSLGLLGMRERARSVGGIFRIASRPGRGTLVLLSLPLD